MYCSVYAGQRRVAEVSCSSASCGQTSVHGLDYLCRQTQFSRTQLQFLYRLFKQVESTTLFTLHLLVATRFSLVDHKQYYVSLSWQPSVRRTEIRCLAIAGRTARCALFHPNFVHAYVHYFARIWLWTNLSRSHSAPWSNDRMLILNAATFAYRVGQIKRRHCAFLLVTNECIYQNLWLLAHINYIKRQIRRC